MAYLLLISIILLLYMELNKIKKQVQSQQIQIDTLCKNTGNAQLTTYYISDEEQEQIIQLKNSGKEVEAVKKVREITGMDLVAAKRYVDAL